MKGVASAYTKLLRLPYQFQLGPIFGWGYLLAGGSFQSTQNIVSFLFVYLAFHIGAFGGLTALNSYYDRDTGPVGGMWQPPAPPKFLWHFAWLVQLSGVVVLLLFDVRLAFVYGAIILLALGYSHPSTRWKGHPWKSLIVVATGQGILDFAAGVLTTSVIQNYSVLAAGISGTTLTVIAFYPLTQLYQLDDDTQRGDATTAARLIHVYGRPRVLRLAATVLGAGAMLHATALWLCNKPAEALVLILANVIVVMQVWYWSTLVDTTQQSDFLRVHRLMRRAAILFGAYIVVRLANGGLYS